MTQARPESAEASPSGDRFRQGEVVAGRYELVRRLGTGGMGVVWVALSRGLGVEVALKLLHDASADEVAVERMAREARAAALLGHSGIVRVLDFGRTENGQPFMAMELLQGEDLYRLLKRDGRLSAVDAVSLILPVVDALVIAHKHGIVHRDLKPENLFVARDALGRIEPKILDFGIAKLESADDKRLTHVGALLGSPAYLSPEQAEGVDGVDHRTDIWALGVVLYELVTGELPFDGKTCNAVLRSIANDQPRPIVELAAGNDGLWTIIRKCLRKDPGDRWGSMQALGEALALWLTGEGAEVDICSRSLKEVWLSDGAASRGLRLVSGRPPPEHEFGECRTTDTFDSDRGAPRATRVRARIGFRGSRRTAALTACAILLLAGGVVWAFRASPAATTRAQETPRAAVREGVVSRPTEPSPVPLAQKPVPAIAPDPGSDRAPGGSDHGAPRVTPGAHPKTAPKGRGAAHRAPADAEFGI